MTTTALAFSFPAGDYYFDQPWTLDGVTYLLTLRFNTRAQIWFMDVADATAQPILSGIAMHASRSLLAGHASLPLPQGVLVVYDASGEDSDPGPDSFASTHTLYYGTVT